MMRLMMRLFFFAGWIGLASPLVFAQAPTVPPNLPKLTGELAEQYVHLVLALGQHDPDYVDAFYGPPEWKTKAAEEKKPLDAIHEQTLDLYTELAQRPMPQVDIDRLRLDSLLRQLAALEARTRMLQGGHEKFDEESRSLYDAVAPTLPESHFQEVLAKLEKKVPGSGPLSQRYEQWRKPFIIPKDKLDTVFQLAIKECRERTLAHIKLPPNEGFKVEYV